METCVPPGFRFHPTEEELVGYYLNRKVNNLKIDLDVIIDIDLYRIEPWDIQDKCNLGYDQQNEWYFFSYKDRKYPTGTRTNRATAAGFWKATGRDKTVLSKDKMIGMRKTLVFYKGRAPNGRKSDWIMHEYRMQSSELGPPQEEGWVVCRAFKKPSPSHKQTQEPWNNNTYYHYNSPSFPKTNNPYLINQATILDQSPFLQDSPFDQTQIIELPKLDSPSVSTSFATTNDNAFAQEIDHDDKRLSLGEQYSDWKSFDKLLACQDIGLSSFEYPNMALVPHSDELDDHGHISHIVLECFSDL